MLENEFFPKPLLDYLISTTTPESELLKQLREDTNAGTKLAHMLCGPVEGKLLNLLVKISGAKYCLELGTFTGYSALNIAAALPEDGKLITLERNGIFAQIAQKYFNLSEHGHKIQLIKAFAMETLKTLNGPFDFVFIDADKNNYLNYFQAILPKVKPGGLIMVDNALWSGNVVNPADKETKSIDDLNKYAVNHKEIECVMLPIRDGILLCRKT